MELFVQLPVEDVLFSNIFLHLDVIDLLALQSTCKRMCETVKHFFLCYMRVLDFTQKSNIKFFKSKYFKKLFENERTVVKEVNFSKMHYRLEESFLCQVAKYCPLLKIINLESFHFQSNSTCRATMLSIAKSCPSVEDLNFSYCTITSSKKNRQSCSKSTLTSIIACYSNLSKLDICKDYKFGKVHFDLISDNLSLNLKGLNFRYYRYFGVDQTIKIAFNNLIDHCTQITTLLCKGNILTDKLLIKIVNQLKNLKKLSIDSSEITDVSMTYLSLASPKLQDLNISLQNITDISIDAISKNIACLQRISIDGCVNLTSNALINLANGQPNINHLSPGQSKIDNILICISKFDSLRSLILAGFDDNLEDLANVIKSLARIEILCFEYCTITDELVLAISEKGETLQELTFNSECESLINDKAATNLVSCCPKLRILDIVLCEDVTDSVLLSIARNCPFMEKLSLYNCQATDHGVCEILKSCIFLTTLEVWGSNITDVSVEVALKHPRISCFPVFDDGYDNFSKTMLNRANNEYITVDQYLLYYRSRRQQAYSQLEET